MKAIVLTRGRIATVDDEDFERVNAHRWTALESRKGSALQPRRTFYAVRSVKKGTRWGHQYLHHFLMGDQRIDHKNGDKLDFRRENLRPSTVLENNRGFRLKVVGASSQFRGVSWDSHNEKWRAKIRVDSKTKHLGRFVTEEDAARGYDTAARFHWGEFAAPNFQP